MEDTCVSINVGLPIDDKVICQLSASDHMRHPEDLKPQQGFTYRGTEVRHLSTNSYYSQSRWGVLVVNELMNLLMEYWFRSLIE